MSADADRFKRAIVDVLAKRSANVCSNPDCQAVTSGPSDDDDRAIVVGEAAHIYGANPGSARFDDKMSSGERSIITNAIWLCRNCHKMIDADASQFSPELLFEWRQVHERAIMNKVGKTSDKLRQKIVDEQLEEFASTSRLARQILIDKPPAWEYRLTAELLRTLLDPVMYRAGALKRGLYAKPLERINHENGLHWFQDRIDEIAMLIPAIMELINTEYYVAWGVPGTPGSPVLILRTCKLFNEGCQQLLSWEERVRFVSVSGEFQELSELLKGCGLRALEQINHIPTEMTRIFSNEKIEGQFEINAVIDLPDGWSQKVSIAIDRLFQIYNS